MQSGLVVSTVTFAFVLLMGQDSFCEASRPDGDRWRLQSRPVLTASVTLPREGYPTASTVRAFHESLFRRASSLAGVRSAALVTDLPLERYERRNLTGEKQRCNLRPSTKHEPVVGMRSPSFRRSGFDSLPAGRSRRRGSPVAECGDRQRAVGRNGSGQGRTCSASV
jgi:hypothetical protein